MIVASMYCLSTFHPGPLLGPSDVPLPAMASFGSSTGSIEKASAVGELSVRDVPKHNANEPFEV